MFTSVYPQVFTAKSYNKSKFKVKKVADNLSTVVADVSNLCNALDTFNTDFGTLNDNVGSDEWSQDAANISTITENIKECFKTYCTNITNDITNINIAQGQANTKLAGTVNENKGKLQGVLSTIESIK